MGDSALGNVSGGKRAAVYARVSTAAKRKKVAGVGANSDAADEPADDPKTFEQRPEIQVEALTAMASQRGWTVVKVYQDRASGAKEKRRGSLTS
jgi:predicted site-specific integrase-resolvase